MRKMINIKQKAFMIFLPIIFQIIFISNGNL